MIHLLRFLGFSSRPSPQLSINISPPPFHFIQPPRALTYLTHQPTRYYFTYIVLYFFSKTRFDLLRWVCGAGIEGYRERERETPGGKTYGERRWNWTYHRSAAGVWDGNSIHIAVVEGGRGSGEINSYVKWKLEMSTYLKKSKNSSDRRNNKYDQHFRFISTPKGHLHQKNHIVELFFFNIHILEYLNRSSSDLVSLVSICTSPR